MDMIHVRLDDVKPWKREFYLSPPRVAVLYLLAITLSEVLTTYVHPALGLVAHSATLIALLIHIAAAWEQPIHRLLLTLTFAPLIRLLSLSLPLNDFPQIYWYFIVSVPLFATAFIIARILGLSWSDVGINLKKPLLQVLIALTGFVFGYIEYVILKPSPLITSLELREIAIPGLILLFSTGLMEELLFRGMMQKVGISALGRGSIFYSTAIFMVLHIGYESVLDLIFVFAVGFLWAYLIAKTGSIVGTTVSHGITNIMLFLVFPFLFAGNGRLLANAVTAQSPLLERTLYSFFSVFQNGGAYIPVIVFLVYLTVILSTFMGPLHLTSRKMSSRRDEEI